MGSNLWQPLKAFNLFGLQENESMEMFNKENEVKASINSLEQKSAKLRR